MGFFIFFEIDICKHKFLQKKERKLIKELTDKEVQTDFDRNKIPVTVDGTCEWNNDESNSITEQVKQIAESTLQQSGFVYEETSGLYYDYNTGYYYDAVIIVIFFLLNQTKEVSEDFLILSEFH